MDFVIIYCAAAGWFLLVSLQTIFLAKNSRMTLLVNFTASLVWIILIKNVLSNLDRFALIYALGTMTGCWIGMKIGHRAKS